jgi:hypothetical protein
MKRALLPAACLWLVGVVLVADVARAQENNVKPVRDGFTLLFGMGWGQQSLPWEDVDQDAFAAVAGVGWFVSPKLAVLARYSGLNGSSYYWHDEVLINSRTYTTVAGASAQYWVSDFFSVEAGGGWGGLRNEKEEFSGVGLVTAIGWSVAGAHTPNFQIRAEYAPIFIDDGAVHNLNFVAGLQIF